MDNETIIKEWRQGKTTVQVANAYMKEQNTQAKKKNETKITKEQALAHVEPIIFEFETKDWRQKDENFSNRPTATQKVHIVLLMKKHMSQKSLEK